jgi:uncharacterized caspase-like protein
LLRNAEVTKEALGRVKEFFLQAGPDDLAVLFIAGHGMVDRQGEYFFAPHDMRANGFAERGVHFEDLEALLDDPRAQRKLLLVDTCHAGELDGAAIVRDSGTPAPGVVRREVRGLTAVEAGSKEISTLVEELFSELRNRNGSVVIAAAAGSEWAYEGLGGRRNGVFTHAVLQGLGEHAADLDRNGVVTASELHRYVIEQVLELTGGRQRPTARRQLLEFDYPISSAK